MANIARREELYEGFQTAFAGRAHRDADGLSPCPGAAICPGSKEGKFLARSEGQSGWFDRARTEHRRSAFREWWKITQLQLRKRAAGPSFLVDSIGRHVECKPGRRARCGRSAGSQGPTTRGRPVRMGVTIYPETAYHRGIDHARSWFCYRKVPAAHLSSVMCGGVEMFAPHPTLPSEPFQQPFSAVLLEPLGNYWPPISAVPQTGISPLQPRCPPAEFLLL
jgi:hypothetical protein